MDDAHGHETRSSPTSGPTPFMDLFFGGGEVIDERWWEYVCMQLVIGYQILYTFLWYIYTYIYKYRSLHVVVISHVLEVIHKFRLSALEGFAIPWYIQKAVHLILNVLLLQVNDIERPRSMEAFLPKRPCPSKGVFMNKHVMVCSVMRCKWTMKPSIYATYAILGFLDYMAVAWN